MANDFKYALSWSRLSDFIQCPRKFKHKYIDKTSNFTVQEDSPHLTRGTNVHKALENYLLKKIDGQEVGPSSLPEVESTKPLIDNFCKNFTSVIPEQQIAVRQNWTQTEWFAKDAYYRAIYDLVALSPARIAIVDFKTGKFKDYSVSGFGQLELSAVIGLNMFPEIENLDTLYAYVDHKKTIQRSFTQKDDRERLTVHFTEMHNIVNAEVDFDPKKNEFCNFCPATKLQCQFSRKL
jgi:CRISPR/Cas system-associated exonuclease Cas4 (RecB family)